MVCYYDREREENDIIMILYVKRNTNAMPMMKTTMIVSNENVRRRKREKEMCEDKTLAWENDVLWKWYEEEYMYINPMINIYMIVCMCELIIYWKQ